MPMGTLEARLSRLEAESQIRQLIARYCFTIDDRDLEGIAALFTEDAVVRSIDGVMNATGLEAIMDQYRGRFAVLGPGQHVMHDTALDFVGDGSREARGTVSGHAELWRNGTMMIAALRYRDRYRATPEGWKFAEREIGFLYYVPISDYPGILGVADRNRAYAEPRPADYPERLPSWRAYAASSGS
jgi:ketosteroid isomerase-like protein